MDTEKDLGLVFCGGGAKGAYQIGVWKALNKLKITPKIKAVSGASVGSLNALLFCQENFELALDTWLNVKGDDMLYTDDKKKTVLEKEINCAFGNCEVSERATKIKPIVLLSLVAPPFIPILTLFSPIIRLFCRDCALNFENLSQIVKLLRYSIINGGFFSQEKLSNIIDNILFISNNKKGITAFATLCKAGDIDDFLFKKNVEYINIVNKTPSETREIVLASSALPIIYPKRKIDNDEYFDGGWADNTPIKPLYDLGFKSVIVVYLENNNHNKKQKDFLEEERRFPGVKITRIIPNNNFKDGLMETLTVTPELTRQRIEMGYNDAMSQLSKYL